MKLYDDTVIVVTGGSGFIGSAVVRELNDKGYDNIVIVDNLGSQDGIQDGIQGKWKNLVGKRFYDVIHKSTLFSWLEGRQDSIEAFIHLGACSNTLETDANYLLENNYRYTRKLAEYALHHGHRFVYASSAATYGDGSQGFSDAHAGLEDLKPLNMYGYSKHLVDLWAQREGCLHQLVGLKYFNIFGPNEYHKGRMASALVRMTKDVLQKGKISLFASADPDHFADGEQKRDFLYVKDAARMTVAFLESDVGGIFNVGTGQATSWNELATAVFHALKKPVHIEYIPLPEDLVGKYQNFTQADRAKTSKALGASAITTPVADAVCDYVQHYLLQEARW